MPVLSRSSAVSAESKLPQIASTICLPATRPAEYYESSDEFCVITCYFNPGRYDTIRRNFLSFLASLVRSNVQTVVVECVADPALALPENIAAVRLTSTSFVWQKERLLNIAIPHVPAHCDKIAWIDGDVSFSNPLWIPEACALLDRYAVVQLFEYAIRLPPGTARYTTVGDVYQSFGSVYSASPNAHLRGNYHEHGHSGFGWAARREILGPHGLYDACISGSGDHLMAHGFCGDVSSACIERTLGNGEARRHYAKWARAVATSTNGRMCYVRGTLLHSWHGDYVNRQYAPRINSLLALGFDPYVDIHTGLDGLWALNADRRDLQQWAQQYFAARRDDDYTGVKNGDRLY